MFIDINVSWNRKNESADNSEGGTDPLGIPPDRGFGSVVRYPSVALTLVPATTSPRDLPHIYLPVLRTAIARSPTRHSSTALGPMPLSVSRYFYSSITIELSSRQVIASGHHFAFNAATWHPTYSLPILLLITKALHVNSWRGERGWPDENGICSIAGFVQNFFGPDDVEENYFR